MLRKYLFAFALFILLVPGCAKKNPTLPHQADKDYEIADLRSFPQNLQVYAREYGPARRLLTAERQEELAKAFVNTFFGPWSLKRTTIARREVSELIGRARGYKTGDIPWTQSEMDNIRANANLGNYPARSIAAIAVRPTDLRAVPTHAARFTEPTPDVNLNPFDYFQYSFLPIGTPLYIAHTSQDGRWHYVECPIAGGWVDANDVALVTADFQHNWKTGQYAALIAEDVNLPGAGPAGKDVKAGIGTLLPLIRHAPSNVFVLIPIKNKEGYATTAEISLTTREAVPMPMAMTPANVAKVGDAMMGQPYGWGGMMALRDCSAMLRDLFTPFGIWLPRNSRAQARRGMVISLQGMTGQEKEDTILLSGVPFLSLVGMPGHITLYVGKWKNKAAIFHNVWGVRVIRDGNDDERQIIGRAVVTSIKPGWELENLYRPVTFIDRLRTLTTTRNEN